jgi:hypothetical protein
MAEERTGMVQVELSEEDWKQRAERLASDEASRIALHAKKKTHNKKWNEELIQLRESIEQLTEEVDTRMAWVPAQADMFGGANDGGNGADETEEEAPARRRRGRRSRAEAASATDAA